MHSGEEVRVGDPKRLPMHYRELAQITADHPLVTGNWSGLTAHIFRIQLGDFQYTLKIRREESLVRNTDGILAFMTELMCRRRIESARQDNYTPGTPLHYMVKSIFGSLNHGILLSPWIEGRTLWEVPTREWTDQLLLSYHAAQVMLCRLGIFDWDPCPGNILLDTQGNARLFDFGYAYFFDPCIEYNSTALLRPQAHTAERFESRALFPSLMKGGENLFGTHAYDLWQRSKLAVIPRYYKFSENLHGIGAERRFVWHYYHLAKRWEDALGNEADARALFLSELYRSLVQDMEAELTVHFCTPITMQKTEIILTLLKKHYAELHQAGFLIPGDGELSAAQLLEKYRQKQQAVADHQLAGVGS